MSLSVLAQSEVAEAGARCNLLPGAGGAEHDASGRLPHRVGAVRLQRANRRLRVRVSERAPPTQMTRCPHVDVQMQRTLSTAFV